MISADGSIIPNRIKKLTSSVAEVARTDEREPDDGVPFLISGEIRGTNGREEKRGSERASATGSRGRETRRRRRGRDE